MAEPPRCIHYVGFRDDRYWNAYRVFGGPRIIHRRWDRRALREIGTGDVVVFADGDEHQPVARYNASDLDEPECDPETKKTPEAEAPGAVQSGGKGRAVSRRP